MLLVILKTGSRAALLGIVLIAGALFIKLSLAGKLKMAALGLLLLPVLISATPGYIRDRYLTMFTTGQVDSAFEAELQRSTVESSQSRWRLFKDSVVTTLSNPIFGVGPGVYVVVSNERSWKEFGKQHWMNPHNTYTQISAETGLPGLAFYLAALFFSFRGTSFPLARRLRNPPAEVQELALAVFCLRLTLGAFSVATFFGTNAYDFFFPTLAGLAVAAERCIRRHAAAAPAPAARSPWPRIYRGSASRLAPSIPGP
jgi:O-antigen ligase